MTIRIYTTPTCSYCIKAKELLKHHDMSYEELDAREPNNKAELIRLSGGLMVPIITFGDRVIKGYDGLLTVLTK